MPGSSQVHRIAFLGDIMLGRLVSDELLERAPEWFWGSTLEVLQAADAVIANLECAITAQRRIWTRTHKVFHFRAAPDAIEVLKAGNVHCVSLANNHVLDFEVEGLRDSLRLLDEAGIRHAGAGENAAAAAAPALLPLGDLSIGVLALTDNEPAFAATADQPGTCHAAIHGGAAAERLLGPAIADLRRQGADFVVLSAHLGPNMVSVPSQGFQDFARAALAAGVDLFHGHSAHVFQAVERVGDRAILYDTGDFIDDYAVDPELHNDWSFIFLAELDATGLRRLELRPVCLSFAQVNLARGEEAREICDRMRELCRPFRTPLRATAAGLEVPLRQ
ncbi:MAG: CapA family protein [Kiloniellales bacterium]